MANMHNLANLFDSQKLSETYQVPSDLMSSSHTLNIDV